MSFPGYLESILAELPGMDPEAAVVSWAMRRGRAWRLAGQRDCRARAEG